MKTTGGSEVILSSPTPNHKQIDARSRILGIHRKRTKTNPTPYQAPRGVKCEVSVQFCHRRPQGLLYSWKDDTLYSSQPCD